MARDDAYADHIDWLDVDSADGTGGTRPPRRPWPRWLTLAVTAAAVAVVVAALNVARRDPSAAPAKPGPSSQPASSTRPAPETSTTVPLQPSLPAVSVTQVGHPLLGTTAGWELFGRGPGVLVRIQPAAGRITRTTVPDLRSSGPAYLAAGPDRVMIRPLDNVPGYLVPDGRPAQELDAPIKEGPVFPGPDPTRLWFQPLFVPRPVMVLATFDGGDVTATIPIPDESSPLDAAPDGAGYLLFPGVGGVYDARPDGLRRITTGALLATGPTGWLVVECDESYRCQNVLIGRVDGSRRIVPAARVNRDPRGVISPDGSTAAMMRTGPQGESQLYLLDLVSGRRRFVDVTPNPDAYYGAVVFSPDSTWLFAVTAEGSVVAINPRTAAVHRLGIWLPALSQLVVRPAHPSQAGRHAGTSRLAASARARAAAQQASSAAAKAEALNRELTRTCCRPTPHV